MKRKVVVGLGLAAALGTVIVLSARLKSGSPPIQTWLQQKLVEWRPAAWKSLDFCAQLTRASYDNPSLAQNTLPVLEAQLAFVQSLGVGAVRMDIGYDAYATGQAAVIGNISSLVSSVKAAGQQLVIADASREAYRKNKVPWAQFQTDWVSRVSDLAARYTPAYYLVIKEPGWYAPMISDATTNPLVQEPSSWVTLLSELSAAVKSASPSTKVGISVTGTSVDPSSANAVLYTQILQGAASLASNDILGFDIYGEGDFNGAQSWLSTNSAGGKLVWIPETWSDINGAAQNPPSIDSEYVEVAYDFAVLVGASLMSPFFTDSMCEYGLASLTGSASIISAYQTMTLPSYSTYKQLIGGTIPSLT